jgi:hypothetical protein
MLPLAGQPGLLQAAALEGCTALLQHAGDSVICHGSATFLKLFVTNVQRVLQLLRKCLQHRFG